MTGKAASKGIKGVTKKGAGAIVRKIPVITIVTFVCDWVSGSFAHAAKEATWPVSECKRHARHHRPGIGSGTKVGGVGERRLRQR